MNALRCQHRQSVRGGLYVCKSCKLHHDQADFGHAYTPEAIQASIRAGVKQIDHGQLVDEATPSWLLHLSGPRNPYPGRIGVVAEGALTDLVPVDGDPSANIRLIEDPARNFLMIMKDGRIYKNTMPPL